MFRGELEALTAERGLEVLWLPGRRRAPGSWLGDGIGSAADLIALTYWVPDLAERDVYVCGPPAMVRALRGALRAAAVPRRNLHVEEFALAA